MASRNYHKRRTKERKAKQRAARIAAKKKAGHSRRGFDLMPPLLIGAPAMANAALLALTNDMLAKALPVMLDDGSGYARRLKQIRDNG